MKTVLMFLISLITLTHYSKEPAISETHLLFTHYENSYLLNDQKLNEGFQLKKDNIELSNNYPPVQLQASDISWPNYDAQYNPYMYSPGGYRYEEYTNEMNRLFQILDENITQCGCSSTVGYMGHDSGGDHDSGGN